MKNILIVMVAIALLGIMVFAAGCTSTKISDILGNPDKYDGKEVSVSGKVTEKYWVDILGITAGACQIDDGSGKIWVITKQEPPEEGEKASARGSVEVAGKIGNRSFGTVIVEKAEK
ncbi:MAG: hypothetical protein PHU23_12710 [Dehalococcoidales bacterium]|nr:hypothetical protein [Dehalococcoidales bacterium]